MTALLPYRNGLEKAALMLGASQSRIFFTISAATGVAAARIGLHHDVCPWHE
ncbi:MAG: hypothetical protein R2756_08780 [Bacteroidales bacterium]